MGSVGIASRAILLSEAVDNSLLRNADTVVVTVGFGLNLGFLCGAGRCLGKNMFRDFDVIALQVGIFAEEGPRRCLPRPVVYSEASAFLATTYSRESFKTAGRHLMARCAG